MKKKTANQSTLIISIGILVAIFALYLYLRQGNVCFLPDKKATKQIQQD